MMDDRELGARLERIEGIVSAVWKVLERRFPDTVKALQEEQKE